jgi:hypothetical protein
MSIGQPFALSSMSAEKRLFQRVRRVPQSRLKSLLGNVFDREAPT